MPAQIGTPGFNSASPPAIGSTTPNSGSFTTVTASGITRADGGIGIGTNPSTANIIDSTGATNGPRTYTVRNTQGGTAATAAFQAVANSGSVSLSAYSSSFSSAGLDVADSAALVANSQLSGGLYVRADATAPIIFGIAGSEAARVASTGGFQYGVTVSDKTTAYPVVVGDRGTHFTNTGATAGVTFTLPGAVAGLQYTFIVTDTDGITITAAAGDDIRIAGTVTASGGSVTSTTIGSTLTLVALNATNWVCTATNGTWA